MGHPVEMLDQDVSHGVVLASQLGVRQIPATVASSASATPLQTVVRELPTFDRERIAVRGIIE